ncbi:MAG TPA: glycoside hydrolase domain-containing protein [Armatimonadaceae bacterium]|nr:glycoside hydrolase domain-containing protein [Armatimonadaceae bacterium]
MRTKQRAGRSTTAAAFLPLALMTLASGGAATTVAALPRVATAAGPQQQVRDGRRTLALNDFGSAAERERFQLRGIPAANFGPADASPFASGAPAARLTLARWRAGMDEWPALVLRNAKGLPANWAGYDVLAVDVRNDSHSETVDLALHVQDSESSTAGRHFLIGPGKTQTLRFPLSEMDRVNVGRVREIHLFGTRPGADVTVRLGGLRLEEAVDTRLKTARARLGALRRAARGSGAEAVVATEERAVQELERRLTALGANPAEQERSAIRAEVVALEERVRLATPRAISESRMRRDAGGKTATGYVAGFATSMEKFFPKDVPFLARVAREGRVTLAGNETESVQVLVLADGNQELKDVAVTVGPLRGRDGTPSPALTAQAAPVGFVKTNKPPYKVAYVGWHPDPILDFLSRFDVKAGELQPVWLRVTAPAGTPAGEYTAEVTVRPANGPETRLPLRITVWGFDLPKETHLRTALSFREPMLDQVYGGPVTEEMRQRYYSYLLKYRLNPDNIYRREPPKVSDLELWERQGMNAFNLTYAIRPADLKPNAPYPPELKREILAQLDAIVPELKRKGLYSKAYLYGFDEVSEGSFAAMTDIFTTVKAKYPDLPILTTAYDATFGEATGLSAVDAWVPLTPKYDPARVRRAREERGKQVWWYTCIVPKAPYANWFIEYDLIDSRSLMGVQSAKYKPDGFLYYAVNRWPLSKKPITSGPYTDWPAASFAAANGDGSFLCAGPDGPLATVRMENIRDGIEDYEYFWLLEQEVKRLRAAGASAAAVRRAERALEVGPDVVRSLSEFSKSPEAILAKRRAVAEAILEARKVAR